MRPSRSILNPHSCIGGAPMRVKELRAKLELDNPEAQLVPTRDDDGEVGISVLPPAFPLGQPLPSSDEAVRVLLGHVQRVETIRLAIGSFYGLPVNFRIHTSEHGEWVE